MSLKRRIMFFSFVNVLKHGYNVFSQPIVSVLSNILLQTTTWRHSGQWWSLLRDKTVTIVWVCLLSDVLLSLVLLFLLLTSGVLLSSLLLLMFLVVVMVMSDVLVSSSSMLLLLLLLFVLLERASNTTEVCVYLLPCQMIYQCYVYRHLLSL